MTAPQIEVTPQSVEETGHKIGHNSQTTSEQEKAKALKTIGGQSILRHADVSTTQAYYILPNHERAQAGMKKLDKTLRTKYGIKG